jgi:hypothetical protein
MHLLLKAWLVSSLNKKFLHRGIIRFLPSFKPARIMYDEAFVLGLESDMDIMLSWLMPFRFLRLIISELLQPYCYPSSARTHTIFLPNAAFMSVDFPTSVSPQTIILGYRISFLAAISLWIFQKSCSLFGMEKLTWERKASQ